MPIQEITSEIRCGNSQCRVAETKKCVEGLELGQCPHFGKPLSAVDDEVAPSEPGISLPVCELLSTAAASQLVRAGETRVVAIIGARESGKTSLIASVYDLFQQGPISNLQFWHSETLFAFEKACHHSRAASKRHKPATERTKLGNFGFYHIGIYDEAESRAIDLLIADRSGEEYKSVSDDPRVAVDLPEIERADSITILVDGERLLDLNARHNARSDVQMILQGLIDGGVISTQPLALVLTKFDEIRHSNEGEKAQSIFEALVEHIKILFGDSFTEISSFRVAASPATEVLQRGYGVYPLLQYWLSARPKVVPAQQSDVVPLRAMSRFTDV